jgi:hypothetical protein
MRSFMSLPVVVCQFSSIDVIDDYIPGGHSPFSPCYISMLENTASDEVLRKIETEPQIPTIKKDPDSSVAKWEREWQQFSADLLYFQTT